MTRAAKAVPMDKKLHYRWLKTSSGYAAAFQRARDEFADMLEAEAIRRAREGALEPVFYQGEKVGAVRRFSDGLAMFLLRGFRPERYGNKTEIKTEITGAGGGPVQTAIQVQYVDARGNPVDASPVPPEA